jgi:hypothetical protein
MQINMEEAVLAVPDYKTFNEWFFRKLKPEVLSLLLSLLALLVQKYQY